MPFSVGVADVHVSANSSSAVLEFTQTWSSASFRDVGKKRMVLIRNGGGWRIASEEMKTSSTGKPAQATEVPEAASSRS